MKKRNYNSYTQEYVTDIPIIQRDYVQGSDRKAEKRDAFIKQILDTLVGRGSEGKGETSLDFIYGTAYKNADGPEGFIPIDGQQRLTTLALIGWLLAQKTDPDKYRMPELRYRTRHTTEQFCNCLREYRLPKNYNDIRTHLITEPLWMAERWLTDPSVSAMLDLLEAVDIRLKGNEYKDLLPEMARRFFNENPVSFYLLDMNDPFEGEEKTEEKEKGFRLTEDLYIKMNARGKILTAYENWKAQFTGMLESRYKGVRYDYGKINGEEATIPEYFSYAIEHSWTDFFWPMARNQWMSFTEEEKKEYPYPRIDEYFMTLFDYFTEVLYWEGFRDEKAVEKAKERLNRWYHGIEQAEIFAGKKGEWIGRRRISIYRNKKNVISFFRMMDSLTSLSHEKGIDGLDSFFDSLFYHGDWNIESMKIRISEERNTEHHVRFTTNLVKLALEPSFADAWNIPLKMLLRALLRYVIKYPDASVEHLQNYLRTIWGWEQSQRQRVVKGMGVRFNLRVQDYPMLRSITDLLLEAPDVNKSLSEMEADTMRILKLSGEERKREYREKGFGKELAVLGNSSYLKGDFTNIYDSLEKYNPEVNGESYIERFKEFTEMGNTEKIQQLVGRGFGGIRTYPYTDRYRFYGSPGHWDYVFSSSDGTFRAAFTEWMCGNEPKPVPSVDTLDYYIRTYHAFISSRIGDNAAGYYLYTHAYPFEMTLMTGRYSSRPMSGYNKCPYAATVETVLPKNITGGLKITNWGSGTSHGRLYLGKENYSLESTQKGWLWRNEKEPQEWMEDWSERFSISHDGWEDKEGVFKFEGNYLLSEGCDRIETAVAFIEVLYSLITKLKQ